MKAFSNGERIIYQIYPKSFMDSNHDGIGDLNGIITRLDYLKALGVNTLWLNPIFVSPQIDNGYDVSNYFMVDPILGTMEDFDNLVAAVHNKGMELILDFVLNHTSDQHPWFKDAAANPHSIYRDYYLWGKGKGNQLPNNWASFFGGSVWEKDPAGTDDYYFHLFAKEMPDLNWANQEVRQAMVDVAKFWLQHDIDGFRLDAFIHTAKANFEQNVFSKDSTEPQLAEEFYANLPQVQNYLSEFIQELRKLKPDIFILGEAASADIDLVESYTDPQRSMCDSVVTFRYFSDDQDQQFSTAIPEQGQPHKLDLVKFKQTMVKWQTVLQGWSYPALYWSNHDLPRILDKLMVASDQQNNAAKMLAVLMYLQRGIPCIYYGEELGMTAGILTDPVEFEDPNALEFMKIGTKKGFERIELLNSLSASHKMGARSVMQWTDGVSAGFSDQDPWLSAKGNGANVLLEKQDPNSVLAFYAKVLSLKQKQLYTVGQIVFDLSNRDVYAYKRSFDTHQAYIFCNLSAKEQEVALPADCSDLRIQLKSQVKVDHTAAKMKLDPYGTIVLER